MIDMLDGKGAYAEYIVVSTKMLIHKPEQLTWEEAAGVPEVRFWNL
jgi:NADPH:quinone reductase-like Zn-dependent oxidoreductase